MGELVIRVTPPREAQLGYHTVSVEVKVNIMGYAPITARSIIYLMVGKKLGPQLAEGPITEAVGYILGVGLVAAISLTLWKRDLSTLSVNLLNLTWKNILIVYIRENAPYTGRIQSN